MLLNCGVGEDLRVSWTARRSNQSILKKTSHEYSLEGECFQCWCWSWNSNTLATWCKELTHWKRPWCWERLKAGEERDYRGWDVWMVSPTRWTWIWVSSGSWWWTGNPSVLQSMGSQKSQTWLNDWTDWLLGPLSAWNVVSGISQPPWTSKMNAM